MFAVCRIAIGDHMMKKERSLKRKMRMGQMERISMVGK